MQPALAVDRTFVIHVSKGMEERERFMRDQLGRLGIPFTFILDADRDALTDAILEDWFGDELKARTAATSCAAKHLLAYEAFVRGGFSWALILEDDAILDPRFVERCNAVLEEAKHGAHVQRGNVLVSLENSELKLVPRGEAEAGRWLYRRDAGRSAGAYLLDRKAAETILEQARTAKIRRGCIDWFHNEVLRAEGAGMALYWCHPPIAEQGSHSGLFSSAIVGKQAWWGRRLSWKLQRWYKYRIRYGVRG